jgi:hypothetical protein
VEGVVVQPITNKKITVKMIALFFMKQIKLLKYLNLCARQKFHDSYLKTIGSHFIMVISPPNNEVYGIKVYESVVPPPLCQKAIDFFERSPKAAKSELVYGAQRTWEEVDLTDKILSEDLIMKRVQIRLRGTIDRYLDEHIAQPDLREQVRKGCYKFEPRMKKYAEGDAFPLHSDEGSLMAITRKFAYILYLNDDFTGGETSFKDGKGEVVTQITPRAGNVAVFPVHSIFVHEGNRIKSGDKYILNGFVNVLVSSARALHYSGRPPTRLELATEEIRQLTLHLLGAAKDVFHD